MKKVLSILFVLSISLTAVNIVSASEKGSYKDAAKAMEKSVAVTADTATAEVSEMKKAPKEMKGSQMGDSPLATMLTSQVQAVAQMKGTEEGSDINGQVILAEVDEGVMVLAAFNNVPGEGKHGFHVHANGSCDDGGKAAGGHFNPKGVDHGHLPEDGMDEAHVGDMGNLEVDANGQGSAMVVLPGVSLSEGDANVFGKAIILHAKEDDFGQPTGNAGARIACGIIENTKVSPAK